MLSEMDRTPTASADNIVRSNTIAAVWWGHNLDVAGGSGHILENNLLADNPLFGVLTINLPGAFPMYPLSNTSIRNNTLLRGGGNYVGQRRGAVWLFAGSTEVSSTVIENNEIIAPIFRGIHLTGGGTQSITFTRNRIDNPGQDAIAIDKNVKGKGIFTSNTVSGLKAGFQSIVNGASEAFTLSETGNSW